MTDSEIVSFCKGQLMGFHWDDMTMFERQLAYKLGVAEAIDGRFDPPAKPATKQLKIYNPEE